MSSETTEPYGHRGHPTVAEALRASRLSGRLGATLAALEGEGFSAGEAVGFVAGIAHEIGSGDGETWHDIGGARYTVSSLLAGRAAKEWSLGMIERALDEIKEAL